MREGGRGEGMREGGRQGVKVSEGEWGREGVKEGASKQLVRE